MALEIAQPFGDQGIVATYWRILGQQRDYANCRMSVAVGAYISRASREMNERPLATIEEVFIIADANEAHTQIQLYEMLKELPQYAGAADNHLPPPPKPEPEPQQELVNPIDAAKAAEAAQENGGE